MAGLTTTVRLVGMSRLSAWARRRQFIKVSTWLVLLVVGTVGLPISFFDLQFEYWLLICLCFGAVMKALHYVSGFSRVTLGVDRVVARSLVGSYAIRQAELVRFRYVGSESAPHEWHLETANGLHPVGAGPAANALIARMVAQWPHIPRPSDAQLRALGAGDYRHESKDPAELVVWCTRALG